MREESFFSKKLAKLNNADLMNYIENKDHFQDYAVLSAILELEKRGITVENAETLKQELVPEAIVENTTNPEIAEPIKINSASTSQKPVLYSPQFVFIFGILFSVLGGGILMAMNLMQLKKIKAARFAVLSALTYSISIYILLEVLGITNPIVSVLSTFLGLFLLEQFIWKKEVSPNLVFEKRAIWKPIVVGLIIALPLAMYLIATGNIPQP
jgi:hypothetical protein